MHQIFMALESELRQLGAALQSIIGDDRPLSEVHGNGMIASLDRTELSRIATSLADRIVSDAGSKINANEDLLSRYVSRLAFLRTATIPHIANGNANVAIPAYLATLRALEQAIEPSLVIDPVTVGENVRIAKSITTKLRGLDAQIVDLSPKVNTLQAMADDIIQAHAAADQLPTDLVALREARTEIQSLRDSAKADREAAAKLLDDMKLFESSAKMRIDQSEKFQKIQAEAWNAYTEDVKESAKGIITRCEDAMRTSTSFGLAGAFHDQAKSLTRSMVYWVVGLIAALGAGSYFGGEQLRQLSAVIEESTPPMIIWTRLFISLVSVGAPVWFAWIATKQIGQRFRLAEDYAYKASISKAYEGYRREAVELDAEFQTKLFSSALSRLDEQPLRFVEHKTHGSPWHELLDSDLLKQAMKLAPELAAKFTEMAKEKVDEAQSRRKHKKNTASEPENPDAEPSGAQ